MPQRSPHKRYGMFAVSAVVAICASFFIATKSTLDRRQTTKETLALSRAADEATCLRVNKLYHLIQQQLRVSLKGLPTIKYYHDHPAELHAQVSRTKAEIKAFAPEKC